MDIRFCLRLGSTLALAIAVSSCAVTTDATKSSSQTIENTSDASTEFTSSTSPKDKDSEDRTRKVKEFASRNFDRLREDMAVGNGEHLTSLAALLDIRNARRPAFFKLTKERFPLWFSSEKATPDDVLSGLSMELSRHPELRQ